MHAGTTRLDRRSICAVVPGERCAVMVGPLDRAQEHRSLMSTFALSVAIARGQQRSRDHREK